MSSKRAEYRADEEVTLEQAARACGDHLGSPGRLVREGTRASVRRKHAPRAATLTGISARRRSR
jgi:hypothetical protein